MTQVNNDGPRIASTFCDVDCEHHLAVARSAEASALALKDTRLTGSQQDLSRPTLGYGFIQAEILDLETVRDII